MARYAVILENGGTGWGAYVPDLPGCVATGATAAEASARIRGAIAMHLVGMAEDGEAAPVPTTAVEYVEVEAASGAGA
jgi:predicted RNase H-like HicB family nuclease